VACSYGTVWTAAEAKAKGFDVPPPGAPGTGGRRGGFIHYAPSPGIFIVRPPELGTGGGSVKQ
jgi:hypothetical protein